MLPTYRTYLGLTVLIALALSTSCSDSTGPSVASVEITPADDVLDVGATVQLTAVVKTVDGDVLNRPVTWESSDETVATVSSDGLVSGVGAGDVVISAHAADRFATFPIAVHGPVISVEITPNPAIVDKDRTFQVSATLEDEVGHILDRPVDWTTENAAIAMVDDMGTVTGVELGQVEISATSEGVVGSTTVIVPAPLTGHWLGAGTQGGATLTLDITFQETATGSLSGSGKTGVPGMSLDNFVITSGVRIRGSVSFTMSVSGFEPFTFSGAYTPDDEVKGNINDSGFDNFPMTLTRDVPPPAGVGSAAANRSPQAAAGDAGGEYRRRLPRIERQ